MYAEVDRGDQLVRGHVREELPERLPGTLRGKVPDGVDQGGGRQVDHALLRADPTELAVADELAPKGARVCEQIRLGPTENPALEGLDRGHDDLGATTDRECQAVAFEAIPGIRSQDHVGGRIVWIGIHRIRPVERSGGREADVEDVDRDDRHDVRSVAPGPGWVAVIGDSGLLASSLTVQDTGQRAVC